jgi:hypothetical protein
MKIFFQKWFYLGLLVLLCLVLIWKNYTPGTFLTGWDTLHPEFNFPAAFQKAIYGVWQASDGLGTISGHSKMADLPRIFLLWLASFILPLSSLRYFYIFFCLLAGTVGMYLFLNYLFNKEKQVSLVALLGTLLYIFNLGTLQQFFVPFEMFPTQWAYLPWLLLLATRYLNQPKKTDLFLFALVNLLAIPQAYAAQLWYAYLAFFGLFLLFNLIIRKIKISLLLIILSITLAVNAYWLLPNVYFIVNKANIPKESYNNRLHSQEFLAQNRATGTLKDTLLLKGFYFNWEIFNFNQNRQENLMLDWNKHLASPLVLAVGYLIGLSSFIGLGLALKQKNKQLLVFSGYFVVGFILLANRTFPFNLLFDFLLRFSVFEEALRFSFTKIAILATFGFTIFASYVVAIFLRRTDLSKRLLISLLTILLLFYYGWPYFQGGLISARVRQSIPQAYFSLWSYLDQVKANRVLTLPLNEPAGWNYYTWGYQGSGFIWFGANSAFLDRDSDRWSFYNEEAYREFFYSLYLNNSSAFNSNLHKYKVDYLLWDNALGPALSKNRDQITYKREIERILTQLVAEQKLVFVGSSNGLFLYKTSVSSPKLSLLQTNKEVKPAYKWGFLDYDFQNQDYITNPKAENANFSYRNVLVNQYKVDSTKIRFDFIGANKLLSWGGKTQKVDHLYYFNAKAITNYSNQVSYEANTDSVTLSSNDQTNTVIIPLTKLKRTGSYYLLGFESKYLQGVPLRFCFKNLFTKLCTIEDQLGRNPSLTWEYFLIPDTQELATYELQINVIAPGKIKSESQLSQVLVLPINMDKLFTTTSKNKYSSSIQTIDYDNHWNSWLASTTDLPASSFSKADSRYLVLNQAFDKGWKAYVMKDSKQETINNKQETVNNKQETKESKHQTANSKQEVVNNKQGFLFNVYCLLFRYFPFFFGQEIKEHVLVNNWSNGWKLNSKQETGNSKQRTTDNNLCLPFNVYCLSIKDDSNLLSTNIVIIFLPQYLEFIGFGGKNRAGFNSCNKSTVS